MIESVDLVQAVILIVIGFLAGGINTFAGGGSNLSLPALMMFGLPADVANATNRVAIFMQSLTATHGYYKHDKLDKASIKNIVVPILLGGLFGSVVASYLDVDVLKPLLLATMVAVSLWVVFKSDTNNVGDGIVNCSDSKLGFVTTFIAGFYGGFVQAGVGFLLIAVFVGVLKYDLLKANALKIVAALLFTTVSLVVFIYRDQVAWMAGIYLAIGSILGAVVSVRLSIDIKPKTLKILVLIMTIVASVAALLL
ncbi:sulfite exporter TauE/SafE family protein [Pseudocolwellia agarivorans]|uniref:sulfite exporter TauE/SafE family protein n=1 Tax=Pseudocolwellia agarivorans TaxID=1911682 RepID=UPI0009840D43|nr:sulfite exporter TauE/SafE family protein [Pseudocolwellia agarivorans]